MTGEKPWANFENTKAWSRPELVELFPHEAVLTVTTSSFETKFESVALGSNTTEWLVQYAQEDLLLHIYSLLMYNSYYIYIVVSTSVHSCWEMHGCLASVSRCQCLKPTSRVPNTPERCLISCLRRCHFGLQQLLAARDQRQALL